MSNENEIEEALLTGHQPREITINVKFSKLVIEVIYKVELNDEQQLQLNKSVKTLEKANTDTKSVLEESKPEGGDIHG